MIGKSRMKGEKVNAPIWVNNNNSALIKFRVSWWLRMAKKRQAGTMQSFSINLGSTLTSPMQTNFHLFPFHLELPLQVVTTLVPYGPERPKVGLQDMSGTTEDKVEIFWDPPKGEFTKYTLSIDLVHPASAKGTPEVVPRGLNGIKRRNSFLSVG